MTVIIGADAQGEKLKNIITEYLQANAYDFLDVTNVDKDLVENTVAVANAVNLSEDNLGVMIDAYGAASFMTATKIKGMIAAEVSDERSAYMTRAHNNTRMITMGAETVGVELAKNIVKGFLEGHYDGGRHQIRVDMLNKMC